VRVLAAASRRSQDHPIFQLHDPGTAQIHDRST
jgi:hypothetical protein